MSKLSNSKNNAKSSTKSLAQKLLGIMFLSAFIAISFVIVKSCTFSSQMETYSPYKKFAKGELRKLSFTHAGKPLPQQGFKNIDGQDVMLADFTGEVVLLNIWASWCAPCVKEMPSLSKLQKERGKTLRIITLSMDNSIDDALALLQRKNITNLETYHDPSLSWLSALGEASIPTSVFIDKNGNEIARLVDDINWQNRRVKEFIDAILTVNSP